MSFTLYTLHTILSSKAQPFTTFSQFSSNFLLFLPSSDFFSSSYFHSSFSSFVSSLQCLHTLHDVNPCFLLWSREYCFRGQSENIFQFACKVQTWCWSFPLHHDVHSLFNFLCTYDNTLYFLCLRTPRIPKEKIYKETESITQTLSISLTFSLLLFSPFVPT